MKPVSLGTIALSTALLVGSGLAIRIGNHLAVPPDLNTRNRGLTLLSARSLASTHDTRVDPSDILNGGPPKDGIPSIDTPVFDTADTTPFPPTETVIGIAINGEAKAYPYGMLNWHEIVNDTIGGVNVSITYCPLCDTAIAIDRGETTFGVSGKLYQSCLVMYDRADETLYAQPWAIGIAGPNTNRSLDRIPAVTTTWEQWLNRHPNSQILATDTGYRRNYSRYPYGSYRSNRRTLFPLRHQNQLQHHPKAPITYLWEADDNTPFDTFSGTSYQFVHSHLQTLGQQTIDLNGRTVIARWDRTFATVVVEDLDGTPLPTSPAFAFVYPAFFGQAPAQASAR